MERNARIYVAGHTGLVGGAIVRLLKGRGYERLITASHAELDLTEAEQVERFFRREKPQYVFLAAAKVGGIKANNTYPADFIRVNLQIQTNVIDACFRHRVRKLMFLGSSCIYPRHAPQPIREEHLLTGPLEETNEAYAIAKIAGLLMCKSYNRQHGTNFIAAMPTNLYGPGDNFDPETSHVLPALIRKFHEAKVQGKREVRLWGTGNPRREFLHVDDLARALLFLMERFNASPQRFWMNVGTGEDLSIRELAMLVSRIVGFEGSIVWDDTMPDGTPRKLLDVSLIRSLGWAPRIGLAEGVSGTYRWFLENVA